MYNWREQVEAIPVKITERMLRAAMPNCLEPKEWSESFNEAVYKFPVRDTAMLLAQVGHESNDLTNLEENLNYSAKRLIEVWPKRYPTVEAAMPYARNPEALANDTYGGRLGNTMKGDGWKYRGRGPIMITGKYNYSQLHKDTGLEVLTHPELLVTDKLAGAISACWYFRTFVTGSSIEKVTKQIQGGQLGLTDRNARYLRAIQAERHG